LSWTVVVLRVPAFPRSEQPYRTGLRLPEVRAAAENKNPARRVVCERGKLPTSGCGYK
jgi:hypothetical protein